MKKFVFRSLIILIVLAFISIGVALAHGVPVITVQPTIAAAGGQITITGTDIEPGETFTLTLERAATSIYLGTVTAEANKDQAGMTTPTAEANGTPESAAAASNEPVEGGFTVAYIIPDKTAPGSYTVKATAEDGDATETDMTITAPSSQASNQPSMVLEPTGELHLLDRSKPTSEVIGIVLVAIVSGGLGLWLARKR